MVLDGLLDPIHAVIRTIDLFFLLNLLTRRVEVLAV